MSQDSFIEIGKITKAQGLKGELRVSLSVEVANLELYDNIYLNKESLVKFKYRLKKNNIIIAKFSEIDDINQAQSLIGNYLYIKKEGLPKITDAESFYVADLVGLNVVHHDTGKLLGTVTAVDNYGAGDNVTILFSDKTEQIYPFLTSVFREIDLLKGLVEFTPPEII